MSAGRWLMIGSAALGVGVLQAIGWLIYAIQSKTNFWPWPGVTGVAIAGIGLVALVLGFVIPEDEKRKFIRQRLRAESLSINFQAGRDIHHAGRDINSARPEE